MVLLCPVLAASLLGCASAFTSVQRTAVFKLNSGEYWSGAKWASCFPGKHQSSNRGYFPRLHVPVKSRKSSLVMFTEQPMNGNVNEVDLIKVFGRLAETKLFGDSGAGQCCHGGCFDCQWRDAFEILQSGKPTWIPTYRYHCLDHAPFDSGPDQH